MDEPCSALDPVATLAIEDLIEELKSRYTIVIVTHNMQQAARASDMTAFFNLEESGKPGRLVEMGATEKIFTTPDEEGDRGLRQREVRLMAERGTARTTRRSSSSSSSSALGGPRPGRSPRSTGRWRRSSTRTSSWPSW